MNAVQKDVCEAILRAFGFSGSEDQGSLIPCVLHLQTYQERIDAIDKDTLENDNAKHKEKRRNAAPTEPTVQGSVLLQAMLRLSEPHNQCVVDRCASHYHCLIFHGSPDDFTSSLTAMPTAELLSVCHNATSSRVVDAFIDSPTVPAKAKRKFILSLIEHYHELVDDRIGSRVGDRCWAAADPYLKEKIARSLIPQEQFLAASFFGKFFARNLHLHLLKRKPEEWKALQSKPKPVPHDGATKGSAGDPKDVPVGAADAKTKQEKPERKKRKREERKEDEIDALFSSALGKKVKKAHLEAGTLESEAKSRRVGSVDKGLESVLGAIRSAPSDLKSMKREKG